MCSEYKLSEVGWFLILRVCVCDLSLCLSVCLCVNLGPKLCHVNICDVNHVKLNDYEKNIFSNAPLHIYM